jgi:hypothetical protein
LSNARNLANLKPSAAGLIEADDFDASAKNFFNMRNRVINGCCRVAQRGSVSLSGSNQFGQVDRMLGSLSGSGLGGTFIQQVDGLASGMTFKRGVKFNDISFTSGFITFRHRIEQLNTLDLSGQTITVSAKVYHDYGSSVNVSIGLRKPTAADNFTSTTTIGSDTAVSVSTGTTTVVSATYTLGSTDADNGLELVMYHASTTVSVKNFVIGDIEVQLGTEVGPFERRSYGTELSLCQRYFSSSFLVGTAPSGGQDYLKNAVAGGIGGAYAANAAYLENIKFPVSMRTTPTLTIYNTSLEATANRWQYFNGGSWVSFTTTGPQCMNQDYFNCAVSGSWSANVNYVWVGSWSASAEL